MRDLLTRHVPEHGVFGEEHGAVRTDAEYVWVLDPIDGTKAFITGLPIFGTLVALLHRGKPVMGIIDQPILKERWLGIDGQQSTFNGQPISVRACPALAMPTCIRPRRSCSRRLRGAARETDEEGKTLPAGAATATPTACWRRGHVDMVVEASLKLYDFAALVPS